jgi:hypothetical protein
MMQSVPRAMTRVGAAAARRAGGVGRTAGVPIAQAAGAPSAARLARAAASASPWSGRCGGARTLVRASSASAAPVAEAPKPILLSEYAAPDYTYASVTLEFDLREEATTVTNVCAVEPAFAPGAAAPSLFLHGDASMKLVSVSVDGAALEPGKDYELTNKGLTVLSPPSVAFELRVVTEIKPQENTELEGLYKSSGNFCTQCEAEGFRRITFFQDRPDVMSVFTTRIEADKKKYPVLLSNGNLVESGAVSRGRQKALHGVERPFREALVSVRARRGRPGRRGGHVHDDVRPRRRTQNLRRGAQPRQSRLRDGVAREEHALGRGGFRVGVRPGFV